MAEKKIKITFEVDGVQQTVDSVEELQDALKGVNKEVKDGAKEQGFFSKKTDELKEKFNGLKATLGEVKTGIKDGVAGLKNFVRGFGTAKGAAKGFGTAAKAALAATGIGLLVTAVVSLVNYFKNLEGGAKTLRKIMAGLGAIVSNVAKAFSLVVKGKFSEAFATLKNSVVEATEAVDSQFEAEKKLAELRKRTIIENAKLNQSIEANKKILEDSTLAADERLAALEKITAATKQLQQNQIDDTKLALEAAQAQLTLTNNFEERREKELEIAELNAQLIDQATQLRNIEYDAARVAREIRAAEAEAKKAEAEAQEAEIQKKKEQAAKDAEEKRKQREKDVEEERKAAEERAKIAAEEAAEKKALEEAVAQSKMDTANMALSAITQLAGEGSVIGKAAAVGQATINTYQAATNALANTPAPPPFPQIAAAATIAAGLAQVRNIIKTETIGDTAGGAAAPSIAPPRGPSFDPTQIQAETAFANQNAGETITLSQNRNQPVVRAYVVAEEVTSRQEANKKIDDLARL